MKRAALPAPHVGAAVAFEPARDRLAHAPALPSEDQHYVTYRELARRVAPHPAVLRTLGASRSADEHYAIVTYWRSFEEHEKSHADAVFASKFEALATMCSMAARRSARR